MTIKDNIINLSEDKENKKIDDMKIAESIIKELHKHPYPKDSIIHKLADRLKIEADEVERVAYALLSTFFTGGASKGKEIKSTPKEMKDGIEVEMEHVDTKSPFAEMISKKIRADHQAEFPGKPYYKFLDDMEKELEKNKTTD